MTKMVRSYVFAAWLIGELSIALLGCVITLNSARAASDITLENRICDFLIAGHRKLSAQSYKIAKERNPLKKADDEARYQNLQTQLNGGLRALVDNNDIVAGGVIDAFKYSTYSNATGVMLRIRLRCAATLTFRFLGPVRGWPLNLDPSRESRLANWRSRLENLTNGDHVRFSAIILQSTEGGYLFPHPGETLRLSAKLEALQKD